jgi:acid stress-induced BolA-like protein IbaG/YrbA
MASVSPSLIRKLKKALAERFPPPATIRLDAEESVIGVVTSNEFKGMDSMDRYDMIDDVLKRRLKPEEQHRVALIVGVTPDEETFYRAGVDE